MHESMRHWKRKRFFNLCYAALMHITLELPDELAQRAQAKAAEAGVSLANWIETTVRASLASVRKPSADYRDAFKDLAHLAPVRTVRLGEKPPEYEEIVREAKEARKAAKIGLTRKGGK
jgi:hypothetical protein